MTQLLTDRSKAAKYAVLRTQMYALIDEADHERLEDMEEALREASQTPELEQLAESLKDIREGRTISFEESMALCDGLQDEYKGSHEG